jgi:hypothetical protein
MFRGGVLSTLSAWVIIPATFVASGQSRGGCGKRRPQPDSTLAPLVGYPRDEEMPERSGWGRKFDGPIALPGDGKLVASPAAAILTRFKETG